MAKLSPTMERLLERAPLDWQTIPKELVLSTNPMTIVHVRFTTLQALVQRGAIGLKLKGRPRAKWHWIARAFSVRSPAYWAKIEREIR